MDIPRQKIVNRMPQVKPAAVSLPAAALVRPRPGMAPAAASFAAVTAPPNRASAAFSLHVGLRTPALARFGGIGPAARNQRPLPQAAGNGQQPRRTEEAPSERTQATAPAQTAPAGAAAPSRQDEAETAARIDSPPAPAREETSAPQEPPPADDGWAERNIPTARPESAPNPAEPPLPDRIGAPTAQAEAPASPAAEPLPAKPPPRSETPEAAAPATELLGNPQIPLAAAAAESLLRIERATADAAARLKADAAAKRGQTSALFAARRQALAALVNGGIRTVSDTIGRSYALVAAWFLAGVDAARNGLLRLVAVALATGIAVAARVQALIMGMVAGVASGVNTVIEQVLGIARLVPIPPLPGAGRIRATVLRGAGRIAGVIRGALTHVQRFAALVVGSVLGAIIALASRVGMALVAIATRLASMVRTVVTAVVRALDTVRGWLVGRIRWLAGQVGAVLRRIEAQVHDYIDRSEQQALDEMTANRRTARRSILQILAFCYLGEDYPDDEADNDLLDRVDSTASKEEFEGAARTALARTVARTLAAHEQTLQRFRRATASLIVMAVRIVLDFLAGIGRTIAQAIGTAVAHVAAAIARLMASFGVLAGQIVAGVAALISRVGALLVRVQEVVVAVARAPLTAFSNLARSVVGLVRGFFQRVVLRLVEMLRSAVGSGSAPDPDSLTSGFAAFDTSRLAAAARMASPAAAVVPVLVGVGIVISEATVALILTILFWVGVVLLIILAIILLVLLIRWIIARVRSMPKAKPLPRVRPRPRRRRGPRTPLRWNPSLSYSVVVGSGGLPGTLDTTGRLPAKAPLHGHHVWPKFVGGPAVQPLMSIRDSVHLGVVHPSLNSFLVLTARGLGHTISTHTTDPRNIAFVAHLRRDLLDRSLYSAGMAGYYAGLNAITRPAIPAAAYLRGITSSFPRI